MGRSAADQVEDDDAFARFHSSVMKKNLQNLDTRIDSTYKENFDGNIGEPKGEYEIKMQKKTGEESNALKCYNF